MAKLGIRGWAGVRDQTEPTNFWQKSLEEANSGKLQIQNWNNDDKKKVEVCEGLPHWALSVLEGTRSLVLVLVQLVQDQSFNLGFQLYRASANLRDFCVAT